MITQQVITEQDIEELLNRLEVENINKAQTKAKEKAKQKESEYFKKWRPIIKEALLCYTITDLEKKYGVQRTMIYHAAERLGINIPKMRLPDVKIRKYLTIAKERNDIRGLLCEHPDCTLCRRVRKRFQKNQEKRLNKILEVEQN